MAWYHGPLFPSQREPSGAFRLWWSRGSQAVYAWTTHPADWYAKLLERFGKEGLEFQGAMTLMRLGSLLEKMNIDLDAIKAGADTFNNMLWNNQVQSSTNDWTPIYNARNYKTLTEDNENKKPFEPWAEPRGWPTARRAARATRAPCSTRCIPTVQEAIIGLRRRNRPSATANIPRSRASRSTCSRSAMPWFGSIHFGYDDYSVGLFEQGDRHRRAGRSEGAGPILAALRVPDRTSCRPAWVAWRCQKIRDLFGQIRADAGRRRGRPARDGHAVGRNGRARTRLAIDMPHLQLYARKSMLRAVPRGGHRRRSVPRRAGPGDRSRHGQLARPRRTRHDSAGAPVGDARCIAISISSTSRARRLCQARPARRVHLQLLGRGLGRHALVSPGGGDPNVAALAVMDGKPAEGIFRHELGLSRRTASGGTASCGSRPAFRRACISWNPTPQALAELDACRITRGGLFLDKAHSEQLQQFARAYRALPREKFTTVGDEHRPGGRAHARAGRPALPLRRQPRLLSGASPAGVDGVPALGCQDLAAGKPIARAIWHRLCSAL